jgi:RimJ/RimL family protein N-acetyltransferase
MFEELHSERLLIRALRLDDALFILNLLNSKGWLEFIGDRNVKNLSDAKTYITEILNNPRVHYFVIVLRSNDSACGILTLIQRDNLPHPDFGFALLAEYTGKGIGFEASELCLRAWTKSIKFRNLLAITKPSNTSSVRLLEKLQFHFYERQIVGGEDLAIYRLES